jgi:hypothetical protein
MTVIFLLISREIEPKRKSRKNKTVRVDAGDAANFTLYQNGNPIMSTK